MATGYLFHRHEQFNANTFLNNASGNRLNGIENNPAIFSLQLLRLQRRRSRRRAPLRRGRPRVLQAPESLLLLLRAGVSEAVGAADRTPDSHAHRRRGNRPTSAFKRRQRGAILSEDPSRTGTCSAADQTACFPNGIIPQNRWNPSGLSLLRLFNSFENSPGTYPTFNHNSQQSISYPRRQETIRIDYNVTDNTRIFGRYTQDSDSQVMPYGLGWTSGQNFPLTPTIFQQPAKNASLNITSTLSPTMTNEFIFGPTK